MTIVVDASVALRWCFQLNESDRAEELLRSDDHLIAPDLVITVEIWLLETNRNKFRELKNFETGSWRFHAATILL